MPQLSKQERLEEFYRRLNAAPPADSFDSARKLVDDTLTAVEDELSGLPNEPPDEAVKTDRMYPSKDDNIHAVPGRAAVRRLRSLRQNTYIADNGAIRIESVVAPGEDPVVYLEKPGKDGGHVGPTR
jgi:hypothetical protein